MSNSKFTIDDALRATSAICGGHSPTATIGFTSVVVNTSANNNLVNSFRVDGESIEVTIARSLLTKHADVYIDRRESELRESEAAVERARNELEAARDLVASLRAAVEASK